MLAFEGMGFDTASYTSVRECLDAGPGSPEEAFIVLSSVRDCHYLDELEERGFFTPGPSVLFPLSVSGKIQQKEIFHREGIPTPPYQLLRSPHIDRKHPFFSHARGEDILFMLKVPGLHGSRGVRPARSVKELERMLSMEFRGQAPCYVEHYIGGRDISLSLMGGEEAVPLPPLEICHQQEYFDTTLKEHGFTLKVPAVMEARHLKRMQEAALRAYRALGGHGIIRFDFRLAGDGTPHLLEAVTFAEGPSPCHFSTRSALSLGITFTRLLQKQLNYSCSRKVRRACHYSAS